MSALHPTAATIWDAARALGLDPPPVHFERVPAPVLYEFAAYLIPGRMPHWSYGKAFHALKTRYDYGMGKLYEMVINANPAYAFLLDTNSPFENTFVMAHVMGHADFFRHNHCFRPTPADMLDHVASHARRVEALTREYGLERVELLLDAALALQEQVEIPSALPKARPLTRRPVATSRNPADGLTPKPPEEGHPVDPVPEARDLMQFLVEESPQLETWERDVLAMVRAEMQYFWPQLRTKIMNEGWATYWHVRLMRSLPLSDEDVVNFARLHSAVLEPARLGLNPYLLGYRLFEALAAREGDDALWLAREIHDDVSFVRNYLTPELVDDLHLYTWTVREDKAVIQSTAWEDVRQHLVDELTHGGVPLIEVRDGDYLRRQELYLVHRYEGRPLEWTHAQETLRHLYRLWGRPVHLETVREGRSTLVTCSGDSLSHTVLSG